MWCGCLVEKPLRKTPSRSDTNEISKAANGRPQSMMMKHKRAKACIEADLQHNNTATIKDVMHLSLCENTKKKDQPTPVTNAPADDKIWHMPSHQEFHHKLLQETAQQRCAKLYKHLTEF